MKLLSSAHIWELEFCSSLQQLSRSVGTGPVETWGNEDTLNMLHATHYNSIISSKPGLQLFSIDVTEFRHLELGLTSQSVNSNVVQCLMLTS